MAALGVGLVWWAYWWGLGGVSMVKGWNNNFLQLANPLSPPQFTRQCYVGSGIWPTGKAGDSGPCKSGGGGGPSAAQLRKVGKEVSGRSPTGTTAGSRL